MRDGIIFGAGVNGRRLFTYMRELDATMAIYFCDNYMAGQTVCGTKVMSFEQMARLAKDEKADIILSSDNTEMRSQLETARLSFYEIAYGYEANNYLYRDDVRDKIYRKYRYKYRQCDEYHGTVTRSYNWFREFPYDGTQEGKQINIRILDLMKMGGYRELSILLEEFYSRLNDGKLQEDEYYKNRVGMQLIANIIKEMDLQSVCDMACGHGAFLQELAQQGLHCYGVDISHIRAEASMLEQDDTSLCIKAGSVEQTGFADEMFDVVTIMECLEHVVDPFIVMSEINRILKKGGYIMATVPLHNHCDSSTHVRFFDMDALYSIAYLNGFTDIRIMALPYLYCNIEESNLLLIGKKT